jgi:hypothetical protein
VSEADREAMRKAFTAYRATLPSLTKALGEDEESQVTFMARCWVASQAFEAGWQAAKAGDSRDGGERGSE